jgi:hypothetical protein
VSVTVTTTLALAAGARSRAQASVTRRPGRELDRVGQQVDDDLLELLAVGAHRERLVARREVQRDLLWRGPAAR